MSTLHAELKKSRRRYDLPISVSLALFVLLWAAQTGGENTQVGYSDLLYAIPITNTVVMPLGTAVLASRLWDLESKEKCCRMLLTLQSRFSLFSGKAAAALLQILLIVTVEGAGILALGRGGTEVLSWGQLGWLCLATFAVNAMLFFLWLLLSIRFDNQVPTLASGMLGSLSGLFSAFMPPLVGYFMPWGYFIPLSTVLADWNPETKTIRYSTAPYPLWLLCITLVLLVLFGAMAWDALKRKEV